MRAITFTAGVAGIRVLIDGVTLQRVALDVAPIKAAKKIRMWTPKMEEDYLKQVEKRMADEGIRDDEAKVIINRFKTEIAKV